LVFIVLPNGGEDDEANKIEKYATTFYNDGN
jgi:hypothetical protein